jgi:hypothetical protein
MKFPNVITGLAAAMRLLWWRIRGYRILATQDEKNGEIGIASDAGLMWTISVKNAPAISRPR